MPIKAYMQQSLRIISLRWHYPNQVTGQSNTAYSQPASASSPFY